MKATESAQMNKLQDLSPRTRWQGWTIVERKCVHVSGLRSGNGNRA